MILTIPLAWLQLTREKTRLLVALAGIAFAVILMLIQLGFRDALFDSAVRIHDRLRGEIFLINPQSLAILDMAPFSERRLYQTLGAKDVQRVSPIYIDRTSWKNPQNGRKRNILAIGIDIDANAVDIPEVQQNLDKIEKADFILFDRDSREEFGPIAELFDRGKAIITEVNNRRVTIGGLFSLGTSFSADGNIITSESNFLRILGSKRQRSLIDLGAIELKPGANVDRVIRELRASLPEDILVLSKQQLSDREKEYWQNTTAIGFIFSLGTMLGFIVGTVIVYQILYADVTDQMVEYATLKAMGYPNSYLFVVVLQEALILSILGYIPGFALCLGIYNSAREGSGLPLGMTIQRGAIVLILTIAMCIISGFIAMYKTQSADPAEIF
jgi:putative ABC transport system permease protein